MTAILLILIALAQWADAHTTSIGLRRGLLEGNGLVARLIRALGFRWAMRLKIAVVLTIGAAFAVAGLTRALVCLLALSGGAVVWNYLKLRGNR